MAINTPWFHGSEEHFGSFEPSYMGSQQGKGSPGFWFSNSKHAAGYYGPNIVECDLELNNPLVVSQEMFIEKKVGPTHWARFAKGFGHDAVIIEDVCDGDVYSTVACVFSIENISNLKWQVWDDELEQRVPAPIPNTGRKHGPR